MSNNDNPDREGFLSRWSRRKQEVIKTEEQENLAAPAPEAAPEAPAEPEPMPELPSLDDLLPGQDISIFMHPAVPQSLRNAALRKMWVLDPAIRDFVSEALDYAYDYNTPGMAPGFGPLQASPQMISEVREMMDRAMNHHRPDTESDGKPEAIPEIGIGKPAMAELKTLPQTDQNDTLVVGAMQQPDELPQPSRR